MGRLVQSIVVLNSILSAIALAILMVSFGILSGSILAGFQFPMALLSMAAEGDFYGLWIIGSAALLIGLLLWRRFNPAGRY